MRPYACRSAPSRGLSFLFIGIGELIKVSCLAYTGDIIVIHEAWQRIHEVGIGIRRSGYVEERRLCRNTRGKRYVVGVSYFLLDLLALSQMIALLIVIVVECVDAPCSAPPLPVAAHQGREKMRTRVV